MIRKLTILGLAAVLTVAVAVPAIGAPTTEVPASVEEISVRALAKARLALLTARSAKSESRRAARTAQAALNAANEAKEKGTGAANSVGATGAAGPSGPAGPEGPEGPEGPAGESAPAIQSARAAGGVTTESATFEQLPGGPTVTVTVPPSGLIEVWSQARMTEGGAVSLYEDGQQMPGQNESELCTTGAAGGALFAGFSLFGPPSGETLTVGTPSSVLCGSQGAPGPVLFETTPGDHTYELRYSIGCGCEPEITFSQRLLRVAPRL